MIPETCIAEVIGLPASGKSALVSEMARASPAVRPLARFRSPSGIVAYAYGGLELSPRIIPLLASGTSLNDTRRMIRLSASSLVARTFSRRQSGALVFDQGPIYVLRRLEDGARAEIPSQTPDRWLRDQLSRWARVLDLVIVLDAPDDVLARRIQERSKPHVLKNAPRDRAIDALRAEREQLQRLLARLEDHGMSRVLRIDTSRSTLEQSVGLALQALGVPTAALGPDRIR